MEHHHIESQSIDESILNVRKYWELPKTYEFESEVVEVNENLLRLKQNYFYPEGGGQPSDKGFLETKGNKSMQVIDVQEKDNHIWINVPGNNLSEGELIYAKIDQQRRELLTKNHSAQHLVSAVFWEDFEFDTTRALIDLTETEVEFDKKPDWAIIEKAINEVNQCVIRELPIISKIYDSTQIPELKLRGGVGENHNVYRLVQIGNIDLNACGGTHVYNTSEIGIVAVKKLDGKRLKFISGREGMNYLNNNSLYMQQLLLKLGTNYDELESEIDRLLQQNKELYSEKVSLEREVLVQQLKNPQIVNVNSYFLKIVRVDNLDRPVVIDSIGDLKTNEIWLVLNHIGGFILTSGEDKLTSKIIGELRKQGVKGGGKGSTVMGTLGEIKDIEDILSRFLEDHI